MSRSAFWRGDAGQRFGTDKDPPYGLSPQGEGAQFASSNQTATLDCAGGKARIEGSNDKLTLKGGCTKLEMFGSGNTVTIAFGKNAGIGLVGSSNAISRTKPDGKEPAVQQQLGSGNRLTHGQ